MDYAKILIKSNYEQRGDLVLRSYVRALKKVGEAGKLFLNGDEAFIFGVIDPEGRFHELFTNNIIDYSDHTKLTNSEYNSLCDIFVSISDKDVEKLTALVESVLFDNKRDLGFEVSTMEELSKDIYVEFEAFNNYLSRINPFQRLLPEEDQSYYNAYNNLFAKIKAHNRMKELDQTVGFDEYDINNYENIKVKSYDGK